jgi:site-specific recombinase
MELKDLYSFVLLLVMLGMILGIGVIIFDKFGQSTAVTAVANTSINAMKTEIGGISTTWLGLIVTVSILAIILVLVIRSFGQGR